MIQKKLTVTTKGRGTVDITDEIEQLVTKTDIDQGICHLFIRHTSASLIVCENADPNVRDDLETFMADLVPDGDHRFVHTAEGEDDMPSHIRSILTQTSLSIPIMQGSLGLGTWQGIYVWEHRYRSHQRLIVVSIF